MRKIFILFFCFLPITVRSFHALNQGDVSTRLLIGGVIDPMSGSVVLNQTDLIAKGSQDIVLQRSYSNPRIPCTVEEDIPDLFNNPHCLQQIFDKREIEKQWLYLPHLRATGYFKYKDISKCCFFSDLNNIISGGFEVYEKNGSCLYFRASAGLRGMVGHLVNAYPGVSNTDFCTQSAKKDIRNAFVFHSRYRLIVYASDGSVREYGISSIKRRRPLRKTSWTYAPIYQKTIYEKDIHFLLKKEKLPNGRLLRYHYDKTSNLEKIESCSHDEKHIYASIDIEKSAEGSLYKTSCNTSCELYQTEEKTVNDHVYSLPQYVTDVTTSHSQESIQYDDLQFIKTFQSPQTNFQVEYTTHHRFYKVSELRALDANGCYRTLYNIQYTGEEIGSGSTIATAYDGSSVTYRYHQCLLRSIEEKDTGGKLVRRKIFAWTNKQHLKQTEIFDGDNRSLRKMSYEYDRYGNPIKETLSHKGSSWTITRKFAGNNLHNLLWEEQPNGVVTEYTYVKNTSLVKKKHIYLGDTIFEEENFVYDAHYNLISAEKVQGDFRKKSVYKIRENGPFLHMPEEETVFISDNQTERKVWSYDQYGNICQEDYYDKDNKWQFSTYKIFNERGQVLSETNPLGQTATYSYDHLGNLIEHIDFSQNFTEKWIYDLKNRPIKGLQVTNETTRETQFTYDLENQIIEKIDYLGNRWQYTYDPVHHKIVEETVGNSSIKKTYNTLGLLEKEIDANGNTKIYSYDARGCVTKIEYPNGTYQKCTYDNMGNCTHNKDLDGNITENTYNPVGQLLKQTKAGRSQKFYYAGAYLTKQVDTEGNITYYSYNNLGQKQKETIAGRVTEYAYNTIGQLISVKLGDLETKYTKDLLGRTLEEQIWDQNTLLKETSYNYDVAGNLAQTTRKVDGKDSVFKRFYDGFNRVTRQIDPLGQVTQTLYYEFDGNAVSETTDPLEITTIVHKNIFDKVTEKEIKNAHNKRISYTKYVYDPAQNLIKKTDYIYQETTFLKENTIAFSYDSLGNCIEETQALGSIDEKTTFYTYTPAQRIQTKILPDGIVLSYTYDDFGYIKSLKSSDKTIDQEFTHNSIGYLLWARDGQNTFSRKLDPFGNILEETVLQKTYKKQYDVYNRPVSYEMFDGSTIHYSYDALYLRKIEKTSPDGEVLHTHTFDSYDTSSRLLQETNHLGKTTYTWDVKGRPVEIESTHLSQQITYDASDQVVKSTINHQESNYVYDSLGQIIQENDKTQEFDSLYNPLDSVLNDLHAIVSWNNINYTYDPSGNRIQEEREDGTYFYTYDPLGRLIGVTSNAGTVEYSYDACNRRLYKKHAGCLEIFLYDELEEIGSLIESNVQDFRVLHPQTHRMIYLEIENKSYIPLISLQDNVIALVNLDGSIQEEYSYHAFGPDDQNTLSLWLYKSTRLDQETGFIYFQNRYYDPYTQRWTTQDPLGFIDGSNLYQYCFNNTLKYRDPAGTLIQSPSPFSYYINPVPFTPSSDWGKVSQCYGFEKFFENKSHIFDLSAEPGFEVCSKNGIQIVNGINTSKEWCLGHAKYTSLLGGKTLNVQGVYNATHSPLVDSIEYILNRMNKATTPVRLLHQLWDDFFANPENPESPLTMCHSQGAALVKNALMSYPEEFRKRIIVVAIAPGAYINKSLCKSIRHYVSKKDWVPALDPVGKLTSQQQGTLRLLDPHPDAEGMDHDYRSPTYAPHIQNEINQYKENCL